MHRRRSIATALAGRGRVLSPARLFVPLRSSPSPFTRTRVLVIWTVPASKSTSDHTAASERLPQRSDPTDSLTASLASTRSTAAKSSGRPTSTNRVTVCPGP